MRAVFRLSTAFCLVTGFALGIGAPAAFAQSGDDPSVINPDPQPPGTMPEMPPSAEPGDEGPMVRPAPDADPQVPPEAFGGPLADEYDPNGSADGALDENAMSTDLADPAEAKPETLNELFAELKRTGDEAEARQIARKIQRRWQDSGSATVNLLMGRASQAMGHKEPDTVFDLLDQAIVLAPDYAEAWNRRATAHFTQNEYGKSIADIEQTLSREPRHWGALMGLALILERTEQEERALDVYAQVLNVYPALKSAQDAVGRLSEELTGPAI